MKIFGKIFLILLLCAACAFAGFYAGFRYEGPLRFATPQITAETITSTFALAGELVTVTHTYSALGTFTNSLMFNDWTIPLTTKNFIVTYDGMIKAGVDLDGAEFTIEDKRITIKLPPAYIISHEIDEQSVKVFDSTKNIFNPITVEDVTGFEAEQKAENEKNALAKGLLEEAKGNAAVAITKLLNKLEGFEEYELIYE